MTPERFESLLKGPMRKSLHDQLNSYECDAIDERINEFCAVLTERVEPYSFGLFKTCLEDFYLHCIRVIPLEKTRDYTTAVTHILNFFTEDDYTEQVEFIIKDFEENSQDLNLFL